VGAVFHEPGGRSVPLASEPWVLISINGVLTDVLDVTSEAILEQLETTLQELTGDWRYMQSLGQEPPTQRLGRLAHESGVIAALRYVSAKNPATGAGLAIFTDRLLPGGSAFLEALDPQGRLTQRLPPG